VSPLLPALALATLAGAAPVRLALPGLNGVNLTSQETALYAEVLAQKLLRRGFEVMTSRDVEAVLGVERQRQLMGCAETSGCLVELAGALGVDGIVVGDVGKADEGYVVNVKVLSTRGKPVGLHNGRAAGAPQLRELLEQASWEMAAQLARALGRPELQPKEPRPELSAQGADPRWWAALPGAVAIGGGVAAGLLFVQANAQYAALGAAGSLPEAAAARDAGKTAQTLAWVAAGAGAAAAATAVVLAATLGPRSVSPTAFVTPQGAGVGLVGVFP
jgi:hypothetical protein